MITKVSELLPSWQQFLTLARTELGLDFNVYILGSDMVFRFATNDTAQHLLDIGFRRILWPWESNAPTHDFPTPDGYIRQQAKMEEE